VTSQLKTESLAVLLVRLFHHISGRRRYQALLLLALTLASSVAEVVSLGAVIPFIGVLTQPEKIFAQPAIADFARTLGITTPAEMVLPLTIAFGLAALVAGGLRLLMVWVSLRIATATGTDLSLELYRRTLYQPYRVHIARSSSEIISGITQKVAAVTIVLMSVVGLVTSGVLFATIMAALVAFDPRVAVTALVIFGVGYLLIAWQTRRRLARNSHCIAQEQTAVVKALQEGLGAIRDVLLDGTQAVYIEGYGKAIRPLQRATGENIFINQAPRYAMETLGMILVAGLAYSLTHKSGDVGAALPILGALGLGAQRLLPLLQQMYGNWSYVSGSRGSLGDVLALLDQPLPEDIAEPISSPLVFLDAVTFENVRFRYDSSGPWILDGVNLTINKGGRVGIVGSTGSGKSTALDLLMSLIEPTDGRILVDGQSISSQTRRAWQRTIAHVPQNIYLADSTIAENIAFGVRREMIDMERVREAAKRAQIADFIESHQDGYSAVVGERGVSLSGGQRQRIGIARALYKEASVLIFDEATNALDTLTETAVMAAIEGLNRDLTIVLVAHRLSTLQQCEVIFRVERGQIVAQDFGEAMAKDRSNGRPLPRA
jgi:ATP-binding cassette, subfamily B, bacterial PglK